MITELLTFIKVRFDPILSFNIYLFTSSGSAIYIMALNWHQPHNQVTNKQTVTSVNVKFPNFIFNMQTNVKKDYFSGTRRFRTTPICKNSTADCYANAV